MNRDCVAGASEQVNGLVKEAIGKMSGGAQTQAKGAAMKNAGKA
jgi:uncharacterized protein YjbJ (UPF0337 family)